jgi:hypothetical protein
LLGDITRFYQAASGVVRHALRGLQDARAELEEFNIHYVDPTLLLQDFPLEVIADRFKNSIRKLEASRESALFGNRSKGSAARELPGAGGTTPRSS